MQQRRLFPLIVGILILVVGDDDRSGRSPCRRLLAAPLIAFANADERVGEIALPKALSPAQRHAVHCFCEGCALRRYNVEKVKVCFACIACCRGCWSAGSAFS